MSRAALDYLLSSAGEHQTPHGPAGGGLRPAEPTAPAPGGGGGEPEVVPSAWPEGRPTRAGESEGLVEDIRPAPTKHRAPLGVVELVLDVDQTVKAVGVVYGLEHRILGDGFEATLFLDQYNQRIKILRYEARDLGPLILKVRWIAEANGFDKIICMAPRRDWQEFLRFGYVLEAVLAHYLNGEDAFIMSKFRSQERLTSHCLMEEILQIERILAEPPARVPRPTPAGYVFRLARREDVPALIELYQGIFETYPSPLAHAGYLEHVLGRDAVFAVCTRDDRIVAAASAELHPALRSAELTDCATRREARGLGLMRHLLARLEAELRTRGYLCAYTMARARSYGMNTTFHRLGYAFQGRLVNNCDIFGAYEDMNIWVKRLEAALAR